jgi:outer membrane protein assembly factor BamB
MKPTTHRIAAAILSMTVLALAAAAAPPAKSGSEASAAEWPQWRGPNRDNLSRETGLLKEWPEGGPPLAWKAKGIGRGYSTVSVAGGRIFTMGDGGDASYVHALSPDGGRRLWSAKVGKPGGDYPGTRSTPTVDGGRVYALGQHGDLVCLDAASGREQWRKSFTKDFGGKMMSGWGYAESVLVDGDHVVCTPGGPKGTIVALDKDTGKTVWRTKGFTDSAAYCSIVVAEIGGVRQYVQMTDAGVVGVAADGGKVLWRAPRKGETAVIPTPLVKGELVFVSSGYGVGCNLFRITPTSGGKLNAEQVYQNNEMENHHGGMVVVGDHVYGSSDPGILKCVELKTGKEVWHDRSVGKGSVAYADGNLYLRGEAGPVALVEATPAGYREKGTFEQPDRSHDAAWPHPVVAGGKLYLRDQDVLLCYDVKAK